MVAAFAADLFRLGRVCRLFDVGGVSRRALCFRELSFAVLFTRNFRRDAARDVRRQTGVDSGMGSLLARAFDFMGARRIPIYLLLLSRRVLQGVLGRPAGVRGRRTAERLLGRTKISFDSAKYSSLFSVSRAYFSDLFGARCVERLLVCGRLRRRIGLDYPDRQRLFSRGLHVQLS